MKIVRFNDRIWFGKHKGNRVCDLIHQDTSFIRKLIEDKLIQLDDKTKKHFNEATAERYGRPRQAGNTIERLLNQQEGRYTFRNYQCNLPSPLYDRRIEIFTQVMRRVFPPNTVTEYDFERIFSNIMNKVNPILREDIDYQIDLRVNQEIQNLNDIQCNILVNGESVFFCDATP